MLSRGRSTRLRRRTTGLTRVGVIAVVVMVVILICLAVPAVQAKRHAANRQLCSSRLQQIGLMLHNYHDIHNMFPPGYVSHVDKAGNDTGMGWGWATMIRSQVDGFPLFDPLVQIDFPMEHAFHRQARQTPMYHFLCPADYPESTGASWTATTRDTSGHAVRTICDVPPTSYIAVFGVSEPGQQFEGEGIFFRNSDIRLSTIPDGSSHTLAVGERSPRWCQATWMGSVTGAHMFPPPGSPAIRSVQHASVMTLGNSFEGPPNAANLKCSNFSSRHGDGGNMLFADGHVTFLSSSTNIELFRALSTRAGEESVGEY